MYHPSGGFTPSRAGDYWWYASYGGDADNSPAAATCGASMAETVITLPAPPRNTAWPVISGIRKEGQTLRSTHGTWSGTGTLTYAYQWQRCSRTVTNCTKITGATHSTYKLTLADVGHKITVQVSATDPHHQTANATSTPIGPITA